MTALNLDSEPIQTIINELLQPLETSSNRKKQKQDSKGYVKFKSGCRHGVWLIELLSRDQASRVEHAVDDLSVFVDTRDWRSLEGHIGPLVATLLGVLSTLLSKRQAIKSGVDYLEQELLSAILSLLEKVSDAEDLNKAHVGIEVIIKVIRGAYSCSGSCVSQSSANSCYAASSNPRTSQRALLVVSELARLIPDAVLHNIMPIFTFMGASDFQRDDAYSFSVVEKTISRVVPVLTASLKGKGADRSQMYKEAMPMMSIFTDMAGRLPRHRTLPFFIHLVKSLEAEHFLAPICILLVDRTTTKAGRGGLSQSQAMDLPVSLSVAFSSDDQLSVVRQALLEIQRLSTNGADALLASNNPEAISERTLKQVVALLSFGTTLLNQLSKSPCEQFAVKEIMDLLLSLSGSLDQSISVYQSTLAAAMRLLSADNFFKVILASLRSGLTGQVENSLQVLIQRLPMVRPNVRASNTAVLGEIVAQLGALLKDSQSPEEVLSAIAAVVTTKASTEDAAIAQIVPSILLSAEKQSHKQIIATSLKLAATIIKELGSRIIPHIQRIVEISLLQLSSKSETIVQLALDLLCTLFDTVPDFISSKQLNSVLSSSLEHHTRIGEGTKRLMSAIAKKIQTKALFEAVMDLWKTLPDDQTVS